MDRPTKSTGNNTQGNTNPNNSGSWSGWAWNLGGSAIKKVSSTLNLGGSSLFGYDVESGEKACLAERAGNKKTDTIDNIYALLSVYLGGEFSKALHDVISPSSYYSSTQLDICICSIITDMVNSLVVWGDHDLEFHASLRERLNSFSLNDLAKAGVDVSDLDKNLLGETIRKMIAHIEDYQTIKERQKRRVLIEKLMAKIVGNLDGASEAELNRRVDIVIANCTGSEAEFLYLVVGVLVNGMTEFFDSNVQRLELLVQSLKEISGNLNFYLIKIEGRDWEEDLFLGSLMKQMIGMAAIAKERAVMNEAAVIKKKENKFENVINRVTVHITGTVKGDDPGLKKEIEDFFAIFEGNDVDRLLGLTCVCVCYVIKRCPNNVPRLELLIKQIKGIIGELDYFYAPDDETDLDLSKDQSAIKQLEGMLEKAEEARKAALPMSEQADAAKYDHSKVNHPRSKMHRIADYITRLNRTDAADLHDEMESIVASFQGNYGNLCSQLICICTCYMIKRQSTNVLYLENLLRDLNTIEYGAFFDTEDDLDLSENREVYDAIQKMLAEVQIAHQRATVIAAREAQAAKEKGLIETVNKEKLGKAIDRVVICITTFNAREDDPNFNKEVEALLLKFKGSPEDFLIELTRMCVRYAIGFPSASITDLDQLIQDLAQIQSTLNCFFGNGFDLSKHPTAFKEISEMLLEVSVAREKAVAIAAKDEAKAKKAEDKATKAAQEKRDAASLEMIINTLADLEESYFKLNGKGEVRTNFSNPKDDQLYLTSSRGNAQTQINYFRKAIVHFIDKPGMSMEGLDILMAKLDELFALEMFQEIPEDINRELVRGDPDIMDKKGLRELVRKKKVEKEKAAAMRSKSLEIKKAVGFDIIASTLGGFERTIFKLSFEGNIVVALRNEFPLREFNGEIVPIQMECLKLAVNEFLYWVKTTGGSHNTVVTTELRTKKVDIIDKFALELQKLLQLSIFDGISIGKREELMQMVKGAREKALQVTQRKALQRK